MNLLSAPRRDFMRNSGAAISCLPLIPLLLAALIIAVAWFPPRETVYEARYTEGGPAAFWSGRDTAQVRPLAPFIPAQLPGPLDSWARGGQKSIIIDSGETDSLDVHIKLLDSHESAPPLLQILRGGEAVGEWKVPPGKGAPLADARIKGAPASFQFHLPPGDRAITIRSQSGSWVNFESVTVTSKVSLSWRLAVIAGAIVFYLLVSRLRFVPDPVPAARLVVALVLLTMVVFVPAPVESRIIGWPFTGMWETYTLAMAIPALLAVGWRPLASRWALGSLILLAGLKTLISLLAPAEGLPLRIYDTPAEMSRGEWRTTWDTLAHPGDSLLAVEPLGERSRFPVDWLWRRDARFTILMSYPRPRVEPEPYQGPDWLGLSLGGWAAPTPGAALVILANGAIEANVHAQCGGENLPVPVINPHDAPPPDAPKLAQACRVTGHIVYERGDGSEYSFIPALVRDDGSMESALDEGALRPDEHAAASSPRRSAAAGALAAVFNGGFAIFMAAWLFAAIAAGRAEGSITGTIMFFVLVSVGASLALAPHADAQGAVSPNAISLVIVVMTAAISAMLVFRAGWGFIIIPPALAVGAGLFVHFTRADCGGGEWTIPALAGLTGAIGYFSWAWRNTASTPTRAALVVFIATAPAVFAYYFMAWRDSIGTFIAYPVFSDPLTYQVFAHEIFLEGDWLHAAGEPVITYQPLYRYLVGVLHVVFGQASVAQWMVDVWSVCFGVATVTMLGVRFGLSPAAAGAAGVLYLAFMFGPHFSWHIGYGLQELTSNLFLFALLWAAAGGASPGQVALAALFAVLMVWTRLDRIALALAAVLMFLPPAMGPNPAWGRMAREALGIWPRMIAYAAMAVGAFLLVQLRNLFAGGEFTINYQANINYLQCQDLECIRWTFEQLLLGSNVCVDRAAVPLVAGALIALAALVYRRGSLGAIPLQLPILLFAAMVSYLAGGPKNYEPRFSHHLLPLCVLLVTLFAANLTGSKRRAKASQSSLV